MKILDEENTSKLRNVLSAYVQSESSVIAANAEKVTKIKEVQENKYEQEKKKYGVNVPFMNHLQCCNVPVIMSADYQILSNPVFADTSDHFEWYKMETVFNQKK